jgi:(5-formylfuran-3-yl)methyl phosphate synthase
VALAGSLKLEQVHLLVDLRPDIIGVRGAVCEGKDRKTMISPEKTRKFVQIFHAAATEASAPLPTTSAFD